MSLRNRELGSCSLFLQKNPSRLTSSVWTRLWAQCWRQSTYSIVQTRTAEPFLVTLWRVHWRAVLFLCVIVGLSKVSLLLASVDWVSERDTLRGGSFISFLFLFLFLGPTVWPSTIQLFAYKVCLDGKSQQETKHFHLFSDILSMGICPYAAVQNHLARWFFFTSRY